jgi:voltage-gated potassium channel
MNIVAECLDVKHAPLFNVSERVSIVYTLQVANNLLVQEAQDPGVMLLALAITSNEIEGTLATTRIGSPQEASVSYISYAKSLLDNGINLVGIIRNGGIMVRFDDLHPAENDRLVYVSKSRLSWDEMRELLS